MTNPFPKDMHNHSNTGQNSTVEPIDSATDSFLISGIGWVMVSLLFLVSWGSWFWLIIALLVVAALALLVIGADSVSTESKIMPLLGLFIGALILIGERGYIAKLYYASQRSTSPISKPAQNALFPIDNSKGTTQHAP